MNSRDMMTSSNGNIFRVTGPLCGEFTGPGDFPTQRPVTRSFEVSFDLRMNKRLGKQPWGWWFKTISWLLWRHCNGCVWFEIPLRTTYSPLVRCLVVFDWLRNCMVPPISCYLQRYKKLAWNVHHVSNLTHIMVWILIWCNMIYSFLRYNITLYVMFKLLT